MPHLHFPKQCTAKPRQISHLRCHSKQKPSRMLGTRKQVKVLSIVAADLTFAQPRPGYPASEQSRTEKTIALGPVGRHFIIKVIDIKTFF